MIIEAVKQSAQASINRHMVNINTMLEDPRSIPEHTDVVGAIEQELLKIASHMDILEAVNQYVEWNRYG
jgi:type I site-specific restriction endonuclease